MEKKLRKPEEVIINDKTLREIIDNHEHWLNEDINGWEDMRCSLTNADLSYVDFSNEILHHADFYNVDFTGSKFYNIKFHNAKFTCVNFNCTEIEKSSFLNSKMYDVSFIYTNLIDVDFKCVDLRDGDFSNSNINNINLCFANFGFINAAYSILDNISFNAGYFTYISIEYSTIKNTNFRNENIDNINVDNLYHIYGINDCNFDNCENIPYIPINCPTEGSFIGWKKAIKIKVDEIESCEEEVLVKLLILEDSLRTSSFGRKCRCNKAKVLEITDLNGNTIDDANVVSCYNNSFKYIVGKIVKSDSFDEDRWDECSNGIHFFTNKQEAIDYNFY